MKDIDLSNVHVISNEVSETRRDLQTVRNEDSDTSGAPAKERANASINRPTIPAPAHHPTSSADDICHHNDSVLIMGTVNTQEQGERPIASSSHPISKRTTTRLFLSHFLSTWNSRSFEMGAMLFIAAIFPGTLLPISVYALVRSGAAVMVSPALGSWVD